MTKAIERIYQYVEIKDITIAEMERATKVSNGYFGKQLRKMADIGESILNRVVEYCPDISPEWLLTGTGPMLRDPHGDHQAAPSPISADREVVYKEMLAERDKKIDLLNREIGVLEERLSAKKGRSGFPVGVDNKSALPRTAPAAMPDLSDKPVAGEGLVGYERDRGAAHQTK